MITIICLSLACAVLLAAVLFGGSTDWKRLGMREAEHNRILRRQNEQLIRRLSELEGRPK